VTAACLPSILPLLDYAVYIRETTKPWKIFVWSWAGFFFSQFLIEALGAALMTSIHGSPAFTAAYEARGVGGLTGQIFEGYGTGVRGFGKFIEVILSFSVVAVVITNIYSLGLNIQIVSNYLLVVPRLIWTTIAGIIFLVRRFLLLQVFLMHVPAGQFTNLVYKRLPQLQAATTFKKSWKTS
jgi:purine-cytosine permease-like protein